jgi:hypothetical protein
MPAARSSFTLQKIPGTKTPITFSRGGHFAFGAPPVALWNDPGKDRVGWLNLETGDFTPLFAAKYVGAAAVADGIAAAGFDDKLAILDPSRNKTPVRAAAGSVDEIAIGAEAILTLHTHAKLKSSRVHVWDRAKLTVKKVLDTEPSRTALSPAGNVAITVALTPRHPATLALWRPPYARAQTIDLEAAVHALAFSSDGTRLAILFEKQLAIVDVATGKITSRISVPPSRGTKLGVLRTDIYNRSWVYPLDDGRVIVVDFARSGSIQELAIELWDVAARKRVAAEIVTLREGKHRGIAENIAISEAGVLLNRERLYRIPPAKATAGKPGQARPRS